jgi:hypothetical protein
MTTAGEYPGSGAALADRVETVVSPRAAAELKAERPKKRRRVKGDMITIVRIE